MRLTRFTRSIHDLCQAVETLREMGVAFESVTEHIDVTTAVGRFLLYLLGVFAQWEREMVADNVRCAAAERARQGLPTFSQMLGYDFAGRNLRVINPAEAKNVKRIYRLYLKTGSFSEVARRCEKMGIRGKRGSVLSPESIRIILSRVAYCGYVACGQTYVKGHFKPIVDVALYNAVQRKIEENGNRTGRHRKRQTVYLPTDK